MKKVAFLAMALMLIAGCKEEGMKLDDITIKAEDRPIVILKTDMGDIEVQLRPDKAPKTVENFLKLVNEGFYDGLTFHRVIPNFMIQGGDPEGTGRGGPGYTVPAEISDLKHTPGALATARLPDQANPQKASSGSQFYITVVNTSHLDGAYTIFGYVTVGLDITQKIVNVERDAHDKPKTPIHIQKAYIKSLR